MMVVVNLLFFLIFAILMIYPFLSLPKSLAQFSLADRLRYQAPHNKKNTVYLLLSLFCHISGT